jgi:hypothetical protein
MMMIEARRNKLAEDAEGGGVGWKTRNAGRPLQ